MFAFLAEPSLYYWLVPLAALSLSFVEGFCIFTLPYSLLIRVRTTLNHCTTESTAEH
jgi:hypothetical protein